MQILSKNNLPIKPLGIGYIPFFDTNLGYVSTYSPAVVEEILSPEMLRVYTCAGPRKAQEVPAAEFYAIPEAGLLGDKEGTIVQYYSVSDNQGLITISRSLTRVVGATGDCLRLRYDGAWGAWSERPKYFDSIAEAQSYITRNFPAPRLTRPFAVGDRVRTLSPRINRRRQKEYGIVEGVITYVKSGYGWVDCDWDVNNPDRYANDMAYYTDLELVL